jgi:threonine dehydrogenase-like Zn-dependent dehydrogenase
MEGPPEPMNTQDARQVSRDRSSPVRTMRAAVLTGAGRVRVDRVPVPEPKTGEVRVRLEGCGVCASNLGPWAGPDWMRFPTRPGDLGHEGWGVVDAVGEGVGTLKPGDRVATLFYDSYAEYDVGPESLAVKLPSGLDGKAFPGEPLGCAINVMRRSDIRPGQTVAIVGAGFLGLLLIQLARQAGARVIAVSRRGFARDMARRNGAEMALPLDDEGSALRAVERLTAGRLCERVFEVTGKQVGLDLAASLAAVRGRLIVAGYHQDARQVDMQQWNWRGIDVINAHERDPAIYVRGMAEAIDAVLAGGLRPEPLFTHRFPLERLGEALDATRDRPDGFLKALVTM